MRHLGPIGLVAVALAGCGQPEEVVEPTVDLLDARSQLIRLSMDLRGVHPTEQELWDYDNAIDKDALYTQHAQAWIEDSRFLDRIKEIFNERYLLRTGQVYFDTGDIPELRDIDDRRMADIIANEALSLLEYVVINDLPYSYMITAPHTMANAELAAYWNIDLPADYAGGWVPATYDDDRPHAGMLTMTTTWQRYPSMGGNANRHRANAISKMFLCDDYLSRPIVLNRAAVDLLTVDPENAISLSTGCQSCHASLDPMAANFFGFFNLDGEEGIESTRYRPEAEQEWRFYAGKEPAYYGRPTGNIVEFAQELVADDRFADCAVRTVWEGLTQRELHPDDWNSLSVHADAFRADVDGDDQADMNIKQLVYSIVTDDEYRAAAGRTPGLNERLAGQKLVSPAQLSSYFQEKIGFTWGFRGRNGLVSQDMGLPTLAGGIDSLFVTERQYTPTVGLVFIQERLAQAAAYHVAELDLDPARETDAVLLEFVTINDTPDDTAGSDGATGREKFDQQIRHLYRKITGRPLPADATEPAELIEVWKSLYSVEGKATDAWAGVISAVFRDPQVIFY